MAIQSQNYCSKNFLKTKMSVKVMVLEPMLVKNIINFLIIVETSH